MDEVGSDEPIGEGTEICAGVLHVKSVDQVRTVVQEKQRRTV